MHAGDKVEEEKDQKKVFMTLYIFSILDSAIKHIIYCHLHYAIKKLLPLLSLRCCRGHKVSLNKTGVTEVTIYQALMHPLK